jgi:hypothetical protein
VRRGGNPRKHRFLTFFIFLPALAVGEFNSVHQTAIRMPSTGVPELLIHEDIAKALL